MALFAGLSLVAQEIFTTYIPGLDNDAGRYNYGRVRITSTLDGTALGQWSFSGVVGVTTGGEVWHAFGRYKMSERDLFNTVNAGEQITVTTGLIAKTRGSERNNDYGIPVEVFLVLDPNGQVVPEGSEPNIFDSWDWADELGLGYSNKVSLGIIQPTDYDMADQATLVEYPSDPGRTGLTVDHPAMEIVFDITGPLKGWINDSLLTANSTIAIGFVQRLGTIVDDNGMPDPFNPSLLPVQNEFMLFELVNMHLTVGDAQANTWAGYPVRADGWVDTGAFLGFVYPIGDWVWSASLGKYIYLPAGNVSAAGAWTHVIK
jgi:hypothetical protein